MKDFVIIAGSGRSGTTWVQDSLAKANNMRTLFEPLHPIGVPRAAQFSHQYIPVDETSAELNKFFDQVFSGNMRSLWTNYRIRPDRFNPLKNSPITVYLHSKKSIKLLKQYAFKPELAGYVVKFIRANLMLSWLCHKYKKPAILIVRHPCAVIASRLRLAGADWGADKALQLYRDNQRIVNLVQDEFQIDLAKPMSTASALCAVWCIENVLPMRWADNNLGNNFAVFSYEALMVNPHEQWLNLTNHLGLDNAPDAKILGLPSQQVSPDMRDKSFTPEHIERWKKNLASDDIKDIAKTLEAFGSDYYSVDSALPLSNEN